MDIADSPEGLYVQNFSVSWSDQYYSYPYLTATAGTGFPSDPAYDSQFGFMSTVDLTPYGGSIDIYPTSGYIGATDGFFGLVLSYTLSSPHPVGSPFADPSILGNGSISFDVTDDMDPVIGPYDASSYVPFTLTDISEAPEPAAWVVMLIGVGLVGVALRVRGDRDRTGRQPA